MSAKVAKSRLDQRLVDEGLAASLPLAAAMIMAGEVLVAGTPASSAGQQVRDDVSLSLKSGSGEWVSRGAHKLLTAIDRFGLDFSGRVCLDVGASTGGFTQVMLHNGAARVYSVDVGYGLLDWKLRSDARVVVMERQNARFLSREMFSPVPDFVSSDASFISLRMLLNPMAQVAAENAEAVVLVKPQFEAKREAVGAGGVVRSPLVHAEVLRALSLYVREQTPWGLVGATWSGIKGPKGNIEYLFHLRKAAVAAEIDVAKLVAESHRALD